MNFKTLTLKSIVAALLLFSQVLYAQIQYADFTPESGWYWTPSLSGRGFTIEIQDDVLVMTAYTYDLAGNPEWYLSAGPLEGNNFYQGSLSRFYGGQCFGCNYSAPEVQPGFEGTIRIEWLTQDSAQVRWTPNVTSGNFTSQDSFIIERQLVADAVIYPYQKPQGQWKMVMDFTSANVDFPFLGDILTFDSVDSINGQTQVEGYRESLASAAAGTYDENTDSYIFVIAEDSNTYLLLYDVEIGVNGWRGYAEFYDPSFDPSFNGYPFEAFRTASKSWATTGTGPSKNKTKSNSGILGFLSLDIKAQLIKNKPDISALDKKEAARLLPALKLLELHVQQ